jgi:hemophore-related protein
LADPNANEDSIVNTTCSYPQVVAALNAEDPTAAQQLATTPAAQSWLGTYLASPSDQRRQMLDQARNVPQTQQYAATVTRVTHSCNNYWVEKGRTHAGVIRSQSAS